MNDVVIHPSKILFTIISVLFISTVLCVWLSDAIILLKVICSLTSLSFYLLFLWRVFHGFVAMFWSGRGEVYLENTRGEICLAVLQGDSYISRFLLVLNFKIKGRRLSRSIILLPDAIDKSLFRQLRAQLLLQ